MVPALATLATFALAANAVLAIPTFRRTDIPSRADWKSKNLESYYRFKTRYRNLGCSDIQGTDFYNECCVPLPNGQQPSEQCTPSYCSAPTSVESPVSVETSASYSTTTTASAEVVEVPAVSSTPAPAPSSSSDAPPTDDGYDDDGDYEWVCEGGDDEETTSIAPPTTTEQPQAAPAPTNDGADDGDYEDDDEDLPYCDEVGDDYTPVPTTTDNSAPTDPAPAPPATTEQPATTEEPANNPAPEPTPTPTPTEEAPAPPPTTTAGDDNNNNNGNDGNGNADIQRDGFATFYLQNGNRGACGDLHSDQDLIGAIDQERYGFDFGVKSSECGRRVRITNTNNGKTVDIIIADVCPTCRNRNSIDLSRGAFNMIATEQEGQVPIEWFYLS